MNEFSVTQRVQKTRAQKRRDGYVPVQAWIPRADAEALRRIAGSEGKTTNALVRTAISRFLHPPV